jgi:hypothetical protein
MGMLLLDQSEYIGKYCNGNYSTLRSVASKSKKRWDMGTTFPPILWILFFLLLTILVNYFAMV